MLLIAITMRKRVFCLRNIPARITTIRRWYSDQSNLENLRNIGIIAHIDAGKTTTTERMLFYSGSINNIGNIDDGNTVMDYMPQERDRGITINSAVITLPWKQHRINLIDTPGHVDFTLEVERSLRVIDGAITILDASEGVEAQTITVWRQADRYSVPRVLFLNKMDKKVADVNDCLASLTARFPAVKPLLLQIPVGKGPSFSGVIDLIKMEKLIWASDDFGSTFTSSIVDPSDDLYDEAVTARHLLSESLADLDDSFADHYLLSLDTTAASVRPEHYYRSIRQLTIRNIAIPILMGSSFKNKGIQPLLDAVLLYLPSPINNADTQIANTYYGNSTYKASLCALAFKTIHDKRRGGALTFARLYSGSLHKGDSIYNATQQCTEKIGRVLEVSAEDLTEIGEATAGNIVAISSLKETKTGDTLLHSHSTLNKAMKIYEEQNLKMSPLLGGVNVPEPVFFCSVEPPSMSYQKALDTALECLTREDPSLRVTHDLDTGQTILSGMGELHLEIIADRILKEYKIEVDLGPMQIAYRETITTGATAEFTLDQRVGEQRHLVTAKVSIEPLIGTDESIPISEIDVLHQKHILMSPELASGRPPRRQTLAAVDSGLHSALYRGPLLGYPVLSVRVRLEEFSVKYGTSGSMVTACVAECVKRALSGAGPILLEPLMRLEITTTEDYIGVVLNDLSQRRSQISALDTSSTSTSLDQRHLLTYTPLADLLGYATHLRTSTSGMAHCSMTLQRYDRVAEVELGRVRDKLFGYA